MEEKMSYLEAQMDALVGTERDLNGYVKRIDRTQKAMEEEIRAIGRSERAQFAQVWEAWHSLSNRITKLKAGSTPWER